MCIFFNYSFKIKISKCRYFPCLNIYGFPSLVKWQTRRMGTCEMTMKLCWTLLASLPPSGESSSGLANPSLHPTKDSTLSRKIYLAAHSGSNTETISLVIPMTLRPDSLTPESCEGQP